MNAKIIECTLDDLIQLKKLAFQTFDEAFRPLNMQETIDKYLGEAFTDEKLSIELMTNGSKFYFIYWDDLLAGYLKINFAPDQTDLNDPDSIEVERIYVKKEFKGNGLGKKLMDFAVKQAEDTGKKYLWLGVWEKNKEAIEFYMHVGFSLIGQHPFKIGDELQTDLIMKKVIG